MSRQQISLNGLWRYTPVARVTITDDRWVRDTADLPSPGEMRLPAHWERAGLPDFAGTVRFERTFTAPETAAGHAVWLICRGIDYWATIAVNGIPVANHEGYFQTRAWDITSALQPGENTLSLEVTCPREEPDSVWPDRKRLIKGILSHWDCRPGSWDPQTGQDIHSGGVWHDVLLEVRPALHIERLQLQTTLTPPNSALTQAFHEPQHVVQADPVARVMVTTHLHGLVTPGDDPLWLEVAVGEHSARTRVEPAGGPLRVETVLTIAAPRLWWTWDQGEPYLYPCTVSLLRGDSLIDRQEQQIGLRDIALDPQSGTWTLNGRRIFVRGTNIIPTLWLGEYDETIISRDIDLLRGAHINGVRMCVHVNREELYSALDRAGILVWQDFALQWGYQQGDAFIAEAVRQIKEMVRQLRHHPSIALWCCQNESTQFNREVLDPLLARAAREEDSSRYVRPTSEFDEHLYYGWYRGQARDYTRAPDAAILSEFGAQALPSVAEMQRMVGEAWPPDWRRMAYHDFQYDQTFNVARIALGDSWESFVAASQAYQAELLKTAIERFRRAKYSPVGCLFQFMFMDCWPSVTWSVVSVERQPKAGYHALRRAYQPVLIGADLERDTQICYTDAGSHPRPIYVPLWVVNDRPGPVEGAQIAAALVREPEGQRAVVGTVCCAAIPADAVVDLPPLCLQVPDNWPEGESTLELSLTRGDEVLSVNHYRLRLLLHNPIA